RVTRVDLRRVALQGGTELEVAAEDAEAHYAVGSGLPGERAAQEINARRSGTGRLLAEGSGQRSVSLISLAGPGSEPDTVAQPHGLPHPCAGWLKQRVA